MSIFPFIFGFVLGAFSLWADFDYGVKLVGGFIIGGLCYFGFMWWGMVGE